MAVKPFLYTNAVSTSGRMAGNQVHFICTTQAELPSVNVIDSDTAFAQDTGNPFTRTGGVWVVDVAPPVATNRIIETSGPTSMPVGAIADGQHIIRVGATMVGADDLVLVGKPNTETIQSSTVLHNDATLFFAMVANKAYRFELSVFFDTIAVADFKYRHTGPAAPASVRIFRYSVPPSGVSMADVKVDTGYSASDVAVTGTGSAGGFIHLDGVIENGATAGNFTFQWAQNNSNAGDTSVLSGSHIAYRRVN